MKAIQTVKELGLTHEHQYFVKYKLKLKEMLEYMVKRMVDNAV